MDGRLEAIAGKPVSASFQPLTHLTLIVAFDKTAPENATITLGASPYGAVRAFKASGNYYVRSNDAGAIRAVQIGGETSVFAVTVSPDTRVIHHAGSKTFDYGAFQSATSINRSGVIEMVSPVYDRVLSDYEIARVIGWLERRIS